MKAWFSKLFGPTVQAHGGSQEWSLGHEGLDPGWAFILFLVFAAVTFWSYRRFAPDVPPWRRLVLTALRVAFVAVFLALLVKPVLNITINEPIREKLLVLLDASQSMAFADKRDRLDDLKRAAIGAGLLDPAGGLSQGLPADALKVKSITRWDLLNRIAANEKLDLWRRLAKKADIEIYRFGRDAANASLQADSGEDFQISAVTGLLKTIHPDQPATAIGESLREVLRENRGQPVAGIFVVTDGGNNSGLPPAEAAQVAREQNVPLFVFGMGIVTPPDLILQDLTGPKLAFVKERIVVKAKLRYQGISEKKSVTATLTADGKELDRQTIAIGQDGESDVEFAFIPQEIGDLKLEAAIPALPEETATDNNTTSTKVRIIDNKVHVLFVEQQPSWEFRYLLEYMQRDRRLSVRSVLIDGEPGLDKIKDSPFLPALPDNRTAFFENEVIIIGDVDPADLGETRMKIINQWVEAGGGVIFLAGPKFNPLAYKGTPLEPILPVVAETRLPPNQIGQRSVELIQLKRTVLGESSPYLQLSTDPTENEKIWSSFRGVRWTAPIAKAKPTAQVLLVDTRADRASREGPQPVIAVQEYGAGTCIYIGTNETYRWRSNTGEKYYSRFWGQLMESLSLQRLQGASALTQLKVERPQYYVGEKIVIAGKV
jgi:hypothetical protein